MNFIFKITFLNLLILSILEFDLFKNEINYLINTIIDLKFYSILLLF